MARYGQIRAVAVWVDGVLWSSITHSEIEITVFSGCILNVNTPFTGPGRRPAASGPVPSYVISPELTGKTITALTFRYFILYKPSILLSNFAMC